MSTTPGVTDIHIHIQPWEQMKPAVVDVMRRGHEDHWEFLLSLMRDPRLLLEEMDRSGIARAGLINYPSQEIMGFDDSTNDFAAEYASHDRARLIPFGGVHPRFTRDATRAVDRLVDLGIACLKIHPPHQAFPANAYTEGLGTLRAIYARCEERGLPVMIHTGTSVFPGARSRYGRPMELDDVAIDFPRLRIIMAHGGRPLWMDEAFFVLRRHKNVWLDLSGIPPARLLEWFPRIAEIGSRVLWGTDWPSPGVRSMKANLDQLRAVGLDPELFRGITEENSLALFPAAGAAAAR